MTTIADWSQCSEETNALFWCLRFGKEGFDADDDTWYFNQVGYWQDFTYYGIRNEILLRFEYVSEESSDFCPTIQTKVCDVMGAQLIPSSCGNVRSAFEDCFIQKLIPSDIARFNSGAPIGSVSCPRRYSCSGNGPAVIVGAVLIGVLAIVAIIAGIGKYRYDQKFHAAQIANDDAIAYAVKTESADSTPKDKKKKNKKKKKSSKPSSSTEV